MLHPVEIHVAPGAHVKPGVVLDPENGPIFVDRDARIEPNAVIQGPCYIGPGSIIRPATVIREGTSIGPACRIGGEISASIIHGYTNKQHDGFLGHSYVGEWINLGADTVTSNLKNTYGTIRVFLNGVGVETGQRFVGSIIGDHSKTGIGTILPTGCVIGIAANVFTQRPVPKFVPSFAWLTDEGMTGYRVDKAIQIARTVMERRDLELSDAQCALLASTAERAREVEAPGWA
jgi:UDP-N-acetylglucosamine diphosphorylase/glucosamine-1-phosphate N-acetyltransferase